MSLRVVRLKKPVFWRKRHQACKFGEESISCHTVLSTLRRRNRNHCLYCLWASSWSDNVIFLSVYSILRFLCRPKNEHELEKLPFKITLPTCTSNLGRGAAPPLVQTPVQVRDNVSSTASVVCSPPRPIKSLVRWVLRTYGTNSVKSERHVFIFTNMAMPAREVDTPMGEQT